MSQRICSVPNCDRPMSGDQWCRPCHKRLSGPPRPCANCGTEVRRIPVTVRCCSQKCAGELRRRERGCVTENCGEPHFASGHCFTHYTRNKYRASGKWRDCKTCGKSFQRATKGPYCSPSCRSEAAESPLTHALRRGTPEQVIEAIKSMSRVEESGCWRWQGHFYKDGYPYATAGAGGGKHHRVHRVALESHMGRSLHGEAAHHACSNRWCVNPEHLQPVSRAANNLEMMERSFYKRRIADLEAALRSIHPGHELLA